MRVTNPDERIITLESADGRSYACRLLGVFEFEQKEYGLLMQLGASENESPTPEKSRTVIMQLVEKDDDVIFRTIESDGEFQRVVDYIKKLAREHG